MAERSGFFNAKKLSTGGLDRVYAADSFAKYFASFIGNGVFGGNMGELQTVTQGTSTFGITVQEGQGWINGYWYENSEPVNFTLANADVNFSRIDSVVLRLDFMTRSVYLAIIQGNLQINPVPLELTRNEFMYELRLANIMVSANASHIVPLDIYDTRFDPNECGIVHGVIDQLDTTAYGNRLNGFIDGFISSADTEYNTVFIPHLNSLKSLATQAYNDFLDWLNSLKTQLIDNGNSIIGEVSDIINTVTDTAQGIISDLEDVKAQSVTEMQTAVDFVVSVKDGVNDTAQNIVSELAGIKTQATDDMQSLVVIVEGEKSDSVTNIQNIVSTVEGVKNQSEIAIQDIVNLVVAMRDQAEIDIQELIDGLKDLFGEDVLASLELRISETENQIDAFGQRLDTMEGDVSILTGNVNDTFIIINGQIDSMQSDLGTAKPKIDTLETKVGIIETNIITINSSINSINLRFVPIESDISSTKVKVEALETKTGTLETTVTSINSRLTTAETSIGTTNTNVTNLTTRVTTAEGGISTTNTNVTNLTGRVTTAESNITSLSNTKLPKPTATTPTSGFVFQETNGTTTLKEDAGGGGGKDMFEVYWSQSNSTTNNPGAVQGWTGQYVQNANVLYPDFYNALKSSANSTLRTTLTDYNARVAANGSCSLYVIDVNQSGGAQTGAIKFPTLTNYVRGPRGTETIQNEFGDAIRNITGSVQANATAGHLYLAAVTVGAFKKGDTRAQVTTAAAAANSSDLAFDASLVVPTAAENRPKTQVLYPWIVVASRKVQVTQIYEYVNNLFVVHPNEQAAAADSSGKLALFPV